MLGIFDWIRRSRNGAELLSTLLYFCESENNLDILPEEKSLSGPITFLNIPCNRCWIYPCCDDSQGRRTIYCSTCLEIINDSKNMGYKSKNAVVVWGHVNYLPKQLKSKSGFYNSNILGSYIHDEAHFMLLFDRYKLKPWIQELLLYHGSDLKGLLQIFQTTGDSSRGSMNDIINRAVHHDSRFPMDKLRIRFFSNPFQLFSPHERDSAGILTFEIIEFLELLKMASIFRALLRPEDQTLLRELIELDNNSDGLFQWARFAGSLNPNAREMLNSWKIRLWSKNQITLLYELLSYVEYTY